MSKTCFFILTLLALVCLSSSQRPAIDPKTGPSKPKMPNIPIPLPEDTSCEALLAMIRDFAGKVNSNVEIGNKQMFMQYFWNMFRLLPIALENCSAENNNQINSEEQVLIAVSKPITDMAAKKCATEVVELTEEFVKLEEHANSAEGLTGNLLFQTAADIFHTLIACGEL